MCAHQPTNRLVVSDVVGEIIRQRFHSPDASEGECRLLVPGLTRRIALEIHTYLCAEGITSHLVIGGDENPSEKLRHISAIGLTSKRIGSFVAVANPDQVSHIQDSIRGTGGAIRSAAFAEEWPWKDDGSQDFRFEGAVLDRMLAKWTQSAIEHEWLRKLVLRMKDDSRVGSNRAELFLENILGTAGAAKSHDVDSDPREWLLYAAGVPRPVDPFPDAKSLIDDTTRLCKRVAERHMNDDDLRSTLHARVGEIVSAETVDQIKQDVDYFLDRMGECLNIDLGILALHGCWRDIDHWRRLNAALLADLFDIPMDEEQKVTIIASWETTEPHVVVHDRSLAATYGTRLSICVRYDIPDALFASGYRLQILRHQSVVRSQEISEASGEVHFDLDSTSDFGVHTKKITLRAVIAELVKKTSSRLELHICGPRRPAFALVTPPFNTADASATGDDATPDCSLTVDAPFHIYLFSWDKSPVEMRDEGGHLVEIEKLCGNLWVSSEEVNIADEPEGRAIRYCTFGNLTTTLFFETDTTTGEEFTIEEALLTEVVRPAKSQKLRRLFDMFGGSRTDFFPSLGGMSDRARKRSALASSMTARDGYQLHLVDFSSQTEYASDQVATGIKSFGTVKDVAGLAYLSLPDEASVLLDSYASARNQVIEHVRAGIAEPKTQSNHPVYATHPFFVERNHAKMEELLAEQLSAYSNVIEYVRENRSSLEWPQLFVLLHLECAVHWDDTPRRNSFFLVGPWHPLLVAKRYMVQSAIYYRAKRKLFLSGGDGFPKLAALLRNIQGFRWVLSLSRADRKLAMAYTLTTSDPGWCLSIKDECVGDLSTDPTLVNSLGLRVVLEGGGDNGLARSCLRDFQKAYPSRRCIGIRVRSGYSTSDVVKTIDEHLHGSDGDLVDKDLPGGIRLYLEDALDEDVNAVWTDPPLYVHQYSATDDRECLSEGHPDIYMLPPQHRTSIERSDIDLPGIPRGNRLNAVISQPLAWLTEGQDLVPKTASYESEKFMGGTKSLGDTFRCALALICGACNYTPAVVQDVGLPHELGAPWAVIPGHSISPAVFVKYVRDGSHRNLQGRVLWDYKFDLLNKKRSYYLLSSIPKSFLFAARQFFDKQEIGNDFVSELGCIGVAIGSEALRSGRHALGVIGLVGASRLLTGSSGDVPPPLSSGDRQAGFLIAIDSFSSFFEQSESNKRADLLAVQLMLSESGRLLVSACGVESKFVSEKLASDRVSTATDQARASVHVFRDLVAKSLSEGGIPERLAFLEIIKFGLRITFPDKLEETKSRMLTECKIFSAILSGNYDYRGATHEALVISTEGGNDCAPGINESSGSLWVRLTSQEWPGVHETATIVAIRKRLSKLFAHLPSIPRRSSVPPQSDIQPDVQNSESQDRALPVEPDQTVRRTTSEDSMNDDVGRTNKSSPVQFQKILIGIDDCGGEVYFDPHATGNPLDNRNIMVTGSSGTGKTQFLKYLVHQIREQGKSVLILDLKNDFTSDQTFCRQADLERIFVTFDGLPFNPLIPYPVPHPESGERYLQCAQYIEGISSTLKKVYRLGDQQQAAVKRTIHEAFKQSGIDTVGSIPFREDFTFPDFSSVGEVLQATNETAYNRLDPLFRLNLFRAESRDHSFHRLTSRSAVVDLSQISSDDIKNVLAQLIVLSAHSYYNAQPHSGDARQFLVFDEGHRVLKSDYISKMVRECRAYGVGMVVSSQYPDDFPEEVSASMATKILHSNGRDTEKVKDIVQLLGCVGREADVSNLNQFEALVGNRQHPCEKVRTTHYPLLLVSRRLAQTGTATIDELSQTEGIDNSKLSVEDLVRQLEAMGLAVRTGEKVSSPSRVGSEPDPVKPSPRREG